MTLPQVQFVVAYSRNRVIGRDNELPWRLPSDLAHFKRSTMGKPIIMGRNTWESLGRPLPGRRNVVITRNTEYTAEGADVFPALNEALEACAEAPVVAVIGGGQLFQAALPIADEIIATEIHSDIDGDVFFPELDSQVWEETSRERQPEENGYSFDFVVYRKRGR